MLLGFRVSYFRSPNRSVDPTETPQLPGHNAQALLGLSTSAAGVDFFWGDVVGGWDVTTQFILGIFS